MTAAQAHELATDCCGYLNAKRGKYPYGKYRFLLYLISEASEDKSEENKALLKSNFNKGHFSSHWSSDASQLE